MELTEAQQKELRKKALKNLSLKLSDKPYEGVFVVTDNPIIWCSPDGDCQVDMYINERDAYVHTYN
jgi:hypothetical protein